uniref:Uncharacterized protein n=1 Tax=Cacopsylla melanoneura TaxID=428564 RepID=A0A8D9ENW3_9HEMI
MRIVKHSQQSPDVNNAVPADSLEGHIYKLNHHYMRRAFAGQGKFYSKYDNAHKTAECNPATVDFVRKSLEAGPREKNRVPETETQRYGWYWDVSFSHPSTLRDDRLNFRHLSDPLIRLQTEVNIAAKLNKAEPAAPAK